MIVEEQDNEFTPEKDWRFYISLDEKVLSKRPVNMKDYMKGLGAGLIISVVIMVLYYVLWKIAS